DRPEPPARRQPDRLRGEGAEGGVASGAHRTCRRSAQRPQVGVGCTDPARRAAMARRIVSADSHVAEPEEAYAQIDPAFRDRAPRLVHDAKAGSGMWVDGLPTPVPMAFILAAGRKPEDIAKPAHWDTLDPAGYDPRARLAVQDVEGVDAEVIFPSVGMILCRVKDIDYRKACNDAYNRWLQAFCETAPDRLLGLATVTLRSIEEGLRELRAAKQMGFRGVMFP